MSPAPLPGDAGGIIPGQGPSVAAPNAGPGAFRPGKPAVAEPTGEGLVVALVAVDGFTSPKVLKTPYFFQCSPLEEMPQSYSWTWDDYQTVSSGMHSNPVSPGLAQWAFETLVVDDDIRNRFTLLASRDVLGLVQQLKDIGDSMTPFQLQFGQPALWGRWDVVSGATLRSLSVTERAGERDARYLQVTFAEFPDAPTVTPVPPPPHVGGTGNSTGKQRTKNHTLAILDSSQLRDDRDSLALLAKHYYGSTSKWRPIAKASGLKNTGPNVSLKNTVGKHKPPAKIIVPRLPKGQ